MSTKSKSIQNKSSDERLRKVSKLKVLLNRPELGALGGSILVFIFFGVIAGDTGMFSAYGTINFLEVSANLGIIAVAAALLMIGGEFDLSVGSMIGFAGICIAIPAIYWGWPLWMSILFAFVKKKGLALKPGLLKLFLSITLCCPLNYFASILWCNETRSRHNNASWHCSPSHILSKYSYRQISLKILLLVN